MKLQTLKKKKKGFTLLELLVVLAILAILIAIAIPVYKGQKEKAAITAHKVGNAVSYKAYTSTTKADSYNDMANVRIYINNSKTGKDISSIGLDEEEVLYKRNSEFVVKEKGKNKIYNWIILEEV